MSLLQFNTPATDEDLVYALGASEWPTSGSESIALRFRGAELPAGIAAYLASRALLTAEQGGSILADGDPGVMRLLDRWGVLDTFRTGGHPDQKRADETLLLPVHQICNGESVFRATNDLLDLVLREFSNAREWLPALEWAVTEVIDNIELHANAPVPGVVCARFVPSQQCLEVGVADVGQGILASLRPALDQWAGHGDALKKALQRGVTRGVNVGQGNGLAGALAITKQNRGDFSIWTGDVLFRVTKGKEQGLHHIPGVLPGTGIGFRLYPNRPVRLEDTFIGERGFSYLDVVAGNLTDEPIKVLVEVSNTSTRATGRRLRNKILNILPSMDEAVTIDFTGVERCSSSFLDELFGRLAAELGPDEMRQRVRPIGMNERLQNMAGVVVNQRLNQESDSL